MKTSQSQKSWSENFIWKLSRGDWVIRTTSTVEDLLGKLALDDWVAVARRKKWRWTGAFSDKIRWQVGLEVAVVAARAWPQGLREAV